MSQTLVTIACTAAVLGLVWHTRKDIMATQAQHTQSLRDLKAQNDKAAAEQAAALAKLQDAIANAGNTSPDVDTALAELQASIQRDDDLNPDTPTEPAPPVDPNAPPAAGV